MAGEGVFALIRDAFASLSDYAEGPFSMQMQSASSVGCELVLMAEGGRPMALNEADAATRAKSLAGSHASVCKEVAIVTDIQASATIGQTSAPRRTFASFLLSAWSAMIFIGSLKASEAQLM